MDQYLHSSYKIVKYKNNFGGSTSLLHSENKDEKYYDLNEQLMAN